MSAAKLSANELTELIRRVFAPGKRERFLAIIVDLPDRAVTDNPDWRARREMAAGWLQELEASPTPPPFEVHLFLYRNARANNADLPAHAWRWTGGRLPESWEEVPEEEHQELAAVLAAHPLALAPTEFSATAPLKMLAPRLGFRAATMPGFSAAMVPALRLDYGEVNRRVLLLKQLLDRATGSDLLFRADDVGELHLHLDLRHRTAHASGGLLPEPGTAGNLPSGEAYIVPYEGELEGDPTRSEGTLPVQHSDELVIYRVERNRAVAVTSDGPRSRLEAERLAAEPAAGNLAELGLGVLADFGIEPIGEVLLDEKLGLHVAFGRSEHFGGQVGPAQFSSPETVIHQDHVYLPEVQPGVRVLRVDLHLDGGSTIELMRDGRYAIGF